MTDRGMTEPAINTGVPQGPGTQPPFPAAPAEGKTARLWWGLGAGALALVLCCGGGIATFIAFAVAGLASEKERAAKSVTQYLDRVEAQKYTEAYALLCAQGHSTYTSESYTAYEQQLPRLHSYNLGTFNATDGSMPVTETYSDGSTGDVTYYLSIDTSTGEYEVCGWRR